MKPIVSRVTCMGIHLDDAENDVQPTEGLERKVNALEEAA